MDCHMSDTLEGLCPTLCTWKCIFHSSSSSSSSGKEIVPRLLQLLNNQLQNALTCILILRILLKGSNILNKQVPLDWLCIMELCH